MLYDEKVKNILKKRGISTEKEIHDFLEPSLSALHDPKLLRGMDKASNRILQAIEEKQTVLIYGDYDADGICSVSMLYLFLKSRGLEPIAFIPNRHTDGYGLSEETVEHIASTYFPDLVITVDTGISAHDEVEMLKDCGIDVIVTDHHEPPEILPDCTIIDPKCTGQSYPFAGLCGAGVVFKLIQYIGGVEEALNYVDICAISTIGDIVPLLDENRVLTKLGLEKINGDNPRPSIAYFKKLLKIVKLDSTDITFKLVPRLNASGRMDSAFKGFEFLIGEDEAVLAEKFASIEEDNNERLKQSQEIQNEINKQLVGIDLNAEPAIFVKSENINLGLIGIIASKLCGQFLRPVFVFTADESGNLKASIRSIEGVNVFELLDKHRAELIDVGGHSLAGGLTIAPEKYENFKKVIQAEIKEIYDKLQFSTEYEYDEEIEDKDINLKLAETLEKLEPFGFCNPKPILLLKTNNAKIEPMKSFRHFRIVTESKREVVAFFGSKYKAMFDMNTTKNVLLNLEVDTFFKAKRAKATVKDIFVTPVEIVGAEDKICVKNMSMLFDSLYKNKSNYVKQFSDIAEVEKYLQKKSGTLIITNNFSLACLIAKKYNVRIVTIPQSNGESVVLYNPTTCINYESLLQYKNMLFLDSNFGAEQFGQVIANTFISTNKCSAKIDKSREVFAKYYKFLMSRVPNSGNDIIEIAEKMIVNNPELNLVQLVFTIFVSAELGFISYQSGDIVELGHIANKGKKDLASSKFFNMF